MNPTSQFLAHKILPDGRVVAVISLTYGRARVTIGRGFLGYDDGW